jgi:hypothetical protein
MLLERNTLRDQFVTFGSLRPSRAEASGPRKPDHKQKGLAISQTLEGCRRGRSGVRPLRQPVPPTLLKNSQKMNPAHSRIHRSTLRDRAHPYRSEPITTAHPSTKPMKAASTASSGATFPSSAVRQPSSAPIRCSVDSAVDFRASATI